MAKVEFKLDDLNLRRNLAQYGAHVNKTITLTTEFAAGEGLTTMKTQAPWTDRTTNARSGLWTKDFHTGSGPIGFTKHTVVFGHAMDYGIWLEVANSGKYQIIMPTVVATGQAIMKSLALQLNGGGTPSLSISTAGVAPRGSSAGARQRAEARHRIAGRRTKATGAKRSKSTKRTKRT